jgi:hypothetical protein
METEFKSGDLCIAKTFVDNYNGLVELIKFGNSYWHAQCLNAGIYHGAEFVLPEHHLKLVSHG